MKRKAAEAADPGAPEEGACPGCGGAKHRHPARDLCQGCGVLRNLGVPLPLEPVPSQGRR